MMSGRRRQRVGDDDAGGGGGADPDDDDEWAAMRASSRPDPEAGVGGGSGESGGGAADPARARRRRPRRRQRRRACDHHHCSHALVRRMAEAICICSMNSSSVCLWYRMDVAGQENKRASVEIFLKAAGYLDGAIQHALPKISPEKRKGLPVDLAEGILKAICMQAQGQIWKINFSNSLVLLHKFLLLVVELLFDSRSRDEFF
ncbi:uncharacterized protein LOC127780707 isoform X2 [Oryza glaberrima]|uniref:uncharacterized protein LOC127780707 isoform X2 n=1 Tax=Oryza glaberrima TaxID=4538 RepID=UPI00224C5A12|nr:uncharacterized protein LOC127780707 isoform X2 [Oryza glaberrima]